MKGIYRFSEDFGRMGSLDGIFIAYESEVNEMLGHEVDLGECLGKHSDIQLVIDASNIEVITTDQDFIEKFESIMGHGFETGTNPLGSFLDDRNAGRYDES